MLAQCFILTPVPLILHSDPLQEVANNPENLSHPEGRCLVVVWWREINKMGGVHAEEIPSDNLSDQHPVTGT